MKPDLRADYKIRLYTGPKTRSSRCPHVFGYEKGPMAITIRSIGQALNRLGQGRGPDHHGQPKLQLPPPRFP